MSLESKCVYCSHIIAKSDGMQMRILLIDFEDRDVKAR